MVRNATGAEGRWTPGRAAAWARRQPWIVGCNFTPSTAVNQLEMWQAETFDLPTIERELAWAAGLGMNAVRVFLHDLAWAVDPAGFLGRLERFLSAAASRGIRTMPVLFDDCWHPDPAPGPQPEPVSGVHNSRWLQSPGVKAAVDPGCEARLRAYVQEVVAAHGSDDRVLAWDLYNEVGNFFLPAMSRPPLEKAARLDARAPSAADPHPAAAPQGVRVGARDRTLPAAHHIGLVPAPTAGPGAGRPF